LMRVVLTSVTSEATAELCSGVAALCLLAGIPAKKPAPDYFL
jgi:hypothetical protein